MFVRSEFGTFAPLHRSFRVAILLRYFTKANDPPPTGVAVNPLLQGKGNNSKAEEAAAEEVHRDVFHDDVAVAHLLGYQTPKGPPVGALDTFGAKMGRSHPLFKVAGLEDFVTASQFVATFLWPQKYEPRGGVSPTATFPEWGGALEAPAEHTVGEEEKDDALTYWPMELNEHFAVDDRGENLTKYGAYGLGAGAEQLEGSSNGGS